MVICYQINFLKRNQFNLKSWHSAKIIYNQSKSPSTWISEIFR